MKNLESFENFKSEEIEHSESVTGGELISCTWTDGTEYGRDLYDTASGRVIYLDK